MKNITRVVLGMGSLLGVCVAVIGQTEPTSGPAAAAPAVVEQPLPPAAQVQEFLNHGDLSAAADAMSQSLTKDSKNDQARFSLGLVQFLQAAQNLSQSVYRFGARTDAGRTFLNLPIPENPNPQKISYADARNLVGRFRSDLLKAEATLEPIENSNVKLPVYIGLVQLDFAGNGATGGKSTLWRVLAGMWQNPDINDENAKQFVICLDQGDVYWLRGYCHLLVALSDVILAYDEQDLFNHTAQIFFKSVDSPYPFLQKGDRVFDLGGVDVADVISFVHLLHFSVADRLQLLDARQHFKQMIANSRLSWKSILAETDDDHEWIPNPKQHTVLPHVQVNQEMIDAWLRFLDEGDDILDGKKLIPFWRGDEKVGVNLAKLFFTDPQPFDLVLWIQGPGVAPALEKGELTNKDVYRNLERVFDGDPFSFGAWFN